jgi:HEAT repeat protein
MRTFLVAGLALLAAGCGRSTDDWLRQLQDPDVVKRRQAIRELGTRSGDVERVVAALTDALRDDSGYVRHDAATTLAKFGAAAKPAGPRLTQLLDERELSVRKAAQAALQKIDPETIATRSPAQAAVRKNDAKTKGKGAPRR